MPPPPSQRLQRTAPPPTCTAPCPALSTTLLHSPQAVLNTEQEAVAAEGEAPRAGTAHYAIAMPWFGAWCRYSGFTYDPARRRPRVVEQQEPGPRPGPIDNAPLLGQHPVRARAG